MEPPISIIEMFLQGHLLQVITDRRTKKSANFLRAGSTGKPIFSHEPTIASLRTIKLHYWLDHEKTTKIDSKWRNRYYCWFLLINHDIRLPYWLDHYHYHDIFRWPTDRNKICQVPGYRQGTATRHTRPLTLTSLINCHRLEAYQAGLRLGLI